MSSWNRYAHRVDIYSKTYITNAAGQRKPTWTLLDQQTKCVYLPQYSKIRTNITIEETDVYMLLFPAESKVAYGSRLCNVTDRSGNLIDAGPLEFDSILQQPGFSGKIRHQVIICKRVIE